MLLLLTSVLKGQIFVWIVVAWCCEEPGGQRGETWDSAVIRQSRYAGAKDSRCVMWYQKRQAESQGLGGVCVYMRVLV